MEKRVSLEYRRKEYAGKVQKIISTIGISQRNQHSREGLMSLYKFFIPTYHVSWYGKIGIESHLSNVAIRREQLLDLFFRTGERQIAKKQSAALQNTRARIILR